MGPDDLLTDMYSLPPSSKPVPTYLPNSQGAVIGSEINVQDAFDVLEDDVRSVEYDIEKNLEYIEKLLSTNMAIKSILIKNGLCTKEEFSNAIDAAKMYLENKDSKDPEGLLKKLLGESMLE